MRSLGVVEKISLGILGGIFMLASLVVAWFILDRYLPHAQLASPTTEVIVSEEWNRIERSGKILVGISADFSPFDRYSYPEGLSGFDPELARAIGEKLGLAVEFKHIASEGLSAALAVGQVDLVISAFSSTSENSTLVDFSEPYYYEEGAILVRPGSPFQEINSLNELTPYRVGVLAGSLQDTLARQKLVDKGKMSPTNLITLPEFEAARTALIDGKIDLIWTDQVSASLYDTNLKKVGRAGLPLFYAVAVRKDSNLLRAKVDASLVELRREGKLNELAMKYLGLPDGVQLQPIPTPDPVRAATPLPPSPPNCLDAMALERELNLNSEFAQILPKVRPGQLFQKGWRIINTGTCVWTSSYSLEYAFGNSPSARFGGQPKPLYAPVFPGGSVDLFVNLIAPIQPGNYVGFWQLKNVTNQSFGERLFIGVNIDPNAPLATTTPQIQPPPSATALTETTASPQLGTKTILFIVDRASILAGEPVTFLWSVTDASQVYLYHLGEDFLAHLVPGEGIQTFYPQLSSTYELRIMFSDGTTDSRQISIQVIANLPATPKPVALAPVIIEFQASPVEISSGDCTVLSWKTGGGTILVKLYRSGNLVLNDAPLEGKAQDCIQEPGQVVYRLVAVNLAEQMTEAEISVLVK